MSTQSKPVDGTPEDVVQRLEALVAEAEKILTGLSAEGEPGDVFADLAGRLGAAQRKLKETCNATKERVVDGVGVADKAVRENPYQSLAIALGVGLLAGALLSRRNKD